MHIIDKEMYDWMMPVTSPNDEYKSV
jgi:hypothetical protein